MFKWFWTIFSLGAPALVRQWISETLLISFWLILENKTILTQPEEKKDIGRSFFDPKQITD